MNLNALFQDVQITGSLNTETIHSLVCDSANVKPGDVFFCIQGLRRDGHSFAQEALERGALCVVAQRDLHLGERQLLCDDTRKAYALACANYFGHPASKLHIVGVTGTNGKTTVSTLLHRVLTRCGKVSGLIGTVENRIGIQAVPAVKTTPDAFELQRLLHDMADAGCTYAVMEVSSHALAQERVFGLSYEAGIFTNLTQDHLDYHGDMESYFSVKRRLFDRCAAGIVNLDDPYGRRLVERGQSPFYTCGVREKNVDYRATDIEISSRGVHYCAQGMREGRGDMVSFCTPGMFSVYNSLMAYAACRVLGIPGDEAALAIAQCPGVSGRCEVIGTFDGITVICDYAHTPDGMDNILSCVKGFAQGRIITVFGCGGNRDRRKRPLMGNAAAAYSDLVIVTSDNPRDENPEAIIDEIVRLTQWNGVAHIACEDRSEAIRQAVCSARAGDVIVLAGKGHENYQVFENERTVHFDEREILAEIVGQIRASGCSDRIAPCVSKVNLL